MRKWGIVRLRTALDKDNGRRNKKFSDVTKIPETWDWKRRDREMGSKSDTKCGVKKGWERLKKYKNVEDENMMTDLLHDKNFEIE